jgi:hypothetical protein
MRWATCLFRLLESFHVILHGMLRAALRER